MVAEVVFEACGFFGFHSGCGFGYHLHKPVDFFGFVGVAYVFLSGPQGVGEELSIGVQKCLEGQAGRASQSFAELISAGGVQLLLVAVLFYRDVGDDEVFVEDRLDFGGLDETIEFLAPASPGGVKDHEDGAVVGLRFGFGVGQDGIGGLQRLRVERCGEHETGDGPLRGGAELHAHKAIIAQSRRSNLYAS